MQRSTPTPFAPAMGLLLAGAGLLASSASVSASSPPSTSPALPQIERLAWGRSVDVYANTRDGIRTLVRHDVVIGPGVTQGAGWVLEHNDILGNDELVIAHPADSRAFRDTLAGLTSALVPAETRSLELTGMASITAVPRNATLVIEGDDLGAGDVSVRIGEPPLERADLRILADPWNEGRILIDPVASLLDTQRDGVQRSASGFGVSSGSTVLNLAVSVGSTTLGLRTGGSASDGALAASMADGNGPEILGLQLGRIDGVSQLVGPNFSIDFTFRNAACVEQPVVGDVLLTREHVLLVQVGGSLSGSTVTGMQVGLLHGPTSGLEDRAFLVSAYDAAAGDTPACFVAFDPPATQAPSGGISPHARMRLTFSEAIDLQTASSFDTIQMKSAPGTPVPSSLVVADVQGVLSGRQLLVDPTVPLSHAAGATEPLYVTVSGGADGLADLDGNALTNPLPADVQFSLAAGAASVTSGNVALRFHQVDEDLDGKSEIRGQFLYDLDDEEIDARPVTRYPAVADRNQVIPSFMVPFSQGGIQTPLTPLGSRLMTAWRYIDFGHSATDETFNNIDIEGLNWSPVGGQVVADFYPEFEIALSHGAQLPDEHVSPFSLLPTKPLSGLRKSAFDDNILQDPASPQAVVHPRALGYAVDPADLFFTAQGTPMMPYPLNRSGDPSTYLTYTWRDTAIQAQGGANGNGIDLEIMVDAGIVPQSGQVAGPGEVPSFGLPLLMDFRTYPSDTSIGLNAFDVSLALNSSRIPAFRVFSAGGVNQAGQIVTVDPDLEQVPSGGFNPSSFPAGGATPPDDPVFYIGQADIVVRVSRVHSVWFDSGLAGPDWSGPVLEPAADDLPDETEIVVAFRGATAVSADGFDADMLDPYGELSDATGVTFLGGDATWKDSIDDVDGARYVQMRFSLIGDTVTNVAPSFDSVGLSYQE